MKKILAITVAVMIMLTGCTPIENNLDKRLIVQGIGIDLNSGNYTITAMYMDTQQPVGEADVTSSYAQGEGNSISAALTDTAAKVGKEPLYGQCSFILLGKGVTGNNIKDSLKFFTNYYEFSPGLKIFCSEEKAEDIMKSENMSDSLIKDFCNSEKSTGKSLNPALYEVYSCLAGNKGDIAIARLILNEKNTVLDGAVAFDGDKSAATLDGSECTAAILIRGKGDNIWDNFIESGKEINYSLSGCNTNIKLTDNSFEIIIKAKANLYATDPSEDTRSKIEARIESICKKTIDRILKENNCDIFNFERELYVQNYSVYRMLYNPAEYVRKSNFKVKAEIDLQAV